MAHNLPAIPDNAPVFTESYGFEYNGAWYYVERNRLHNKDHEVAVVYSPGFGGGWASWYSVDPTDARVALLTLTKEAAKLDLVIYDGDEPSPVYFSGGQFSTYRSDNFHNQLAIEWLPQATLYQINEYDGAESVIRNHDMTWRVV